MSCLADKKIYVAGHSGMVGSALLRKLEAADCNKLLLAARSELDLENQQQVNDFLLTEKREAKNYLCQTRPRKITRPRIQRVKIT